MVIIKGLENGGVDRRLYASMQTLDESFKSILPLQNHLVSNLHYAILEPNTTLMGDVAWNSREISSAKNRSTVVPPFSSPVLTQTLVLILRAENSSDSKSKRLTEGK